MRELLARGGAYKNATRLFVASLNGNPALKKQVVDVYTACLKEVWEVLIAFAVLAVLIAVLLTEVELRKELQTEFGLKVEPDLPDVEEHTETEEKLVVRTKPLLRPDAPEDEIIG